MFVSSLLLPLLLSYPQPHCWSPYTYVVCPEGAGVRLTETVSLSMTHLPSPVR